MFITSPDIIFDNLQKHGYQNLIKGKKTLSVFLGGGITGCRDWRQDFKSIDREEFIFINPLKEKWNGNAFNTDEEIDQIKWEREGLLFSDIRLFWFEPHQIQPITLFELGYWSYHSSWKRNPNQKKYRYSSWCPS